MVRAGFRKGRDTLNRHDAITTYEHTGTLHLMGRLWRQSIRQYKGSLVSAVIFMAIVSAATAFSAWLLRPVIDWVFVEKRPGILLPLALAVILTFLIKGGAAYAQSVIMARVGMRIIADNQSRLYDHLIHMDMGFFHETSTGSLISRFTVDIRNMRIAVSNAVTSFGKDSLTLIGLVGVMFFQNFELAIISFFIFPAAIYPVARLGRRMREVTADTQTEFGLLTTLLEQTFQGIRVVKTYCMEEYEKRRITRIIERIFRLTYKSERVRSLSSPIMETLGGFAVAMVILYGGYQVVGGDVTTGAFMSFIAALLMAYEPMKRLANLNASVQEGLAGAQRLFALLDKQPTILDKPGAKPLKVKHGAIRLEDVHFSYEPGEPTLLGIDLEIPAGKTAALAGPSGSGKSTVLNIISRFYEAGSGRVSIDGVDVCDVTMASLRGSIALVSQEIALFDDTVRANIAYGRAGAANDQIIDAARHAAAHDFIMKLPQGYETIVGERGVKLSGGQRQRLAIARAILKDAPILLLDEATSSLDTESERQVQVALEKLMKGRTSLIVAHRLSTIMKADVIHIVADGRIVESGKHEELLAAGGVYSRLSAVQFAKQAPASSSALST